MRGNLTPSSSIDNLKKEAKRWLKALRANVQEAKERFVRALPDAPRVPTLRDVQHALARELGLPGWAALKRQVVEATPVEDDPKKRVDWFLEVACPDHHVRGGPDHDRAGGAAMRILQRYPEIAKDSLATAVVCGDIALVRRILAERPQAANEKRSAEGPDRSGAGGQGDLYSTLGPKLWEPLLFLCFTRLPLPAVRENAATIARLLLDHGADPNVFFMAGSSRYTPLTGAIGEGEEERPPHPQRDALARLLVERGANPFDGQVVYNIHFYGRALWFLELIYEVSVARGHKAAWDDPGWEMLNAGGYGNGARYFLTMAIKQNDVRLAEWVLGHGASPNAPPPIDRRFPKITLYEAAMRLGRREIADLLVRHGATPAPVLLTPMEQFVAACLAMDRERVKAMLAEHPEYLRSTDAIFAATKGDRADVVEMLLDLGVSPDVENDQRERPLHHAGYAGALNVAKLLIERGAEIDPREANWMNTPLGCAVYFGHQALIELFGRLSKDVWELTYTGNVERLREVLREDPKRARAESDRQTPLMWLPPGDPARAMGVVRLLLENGADPAIRNRDGQTAADRAVRLGLFDVAELLRRAESGASGPTL